MRIEDAIKQPVFKTAYEKAIVNILYTGNWLVYNESKLFKEFGLTHPQYNVLRILKGQYPQAATVNLIIERMLDKSSNASRVVEKLRTKGFVVRKICKMDRRRVDVKITEKGLDVLENTTLKMNESRSAHKSLSDEEAETLSNLLDKLRIEKL